MVLPASPYRSAASTTHRTLRQAAQGQVAAIQWALIVCYHNYHLVPDGIFGRLQFPRHQAVFHSFKGLAGLRRA
jgi:hypothetical protein